MSLSAIQFEAWERLRFDSLSQRWFHEFPVAPEGLGKRADMPTLDDHHGNIIKCKVHVLFRDFLHEHSFPFEEEVTA